METKLATTTAQLADAESLAEFLAPIPNSDQLAKLLEGRTSLSTRAYEDETQTARFVESDGTRVMCFTVSDITIDQAEMIELRWEGICALDAAAFQQVVETTLEVRLSPPP